MVHRGYLVGIGGQRPCSRSVSSSIEARGDPARRKQRAGRQVLNMLYLVFITRLGTDVVDERLVS
jgi:hypothetical protein